MEVTVIISNFNGEKLLEKNLPYVLKAKDYPANKIKEIIVVDDASKDESVKLVKSKFPEVKVIKHRVNRGFSAVVNTGARTARGELIVLINNDVVPSKSFLEDALPRFRKKDVFAVSLHEIGYGWAKGKFESGYIGFGPGKEGDKVHESFWVNGGSGVFRRDVWMKLGGMDEELLSPFYWEDIDLSYRAAKRGYRLLWEPKAKVRHKHETTLKTFPQKYVARIKERNQLLFMWKNITSPNLFRKHLAGLLRRTLRHPGYLRIILMAGVKIGKIRKARKKEKKESKVSDEAILAKFS